MGVFGEVGDGGGDVVVAGARVVVRLSVVPLLVADSDSHEGYLKPGEAWLADGEL